MPLLKKHVLNPGTAAHPTSPDLSQEPPDDSGPPEADTSSLPAATGSTAGKATVHEQFPSLGEGQTLARGTVLQNRYVIENTLGVGGMSTVYRGRDLRFRDVVRSCAIKEMYQTAPDSRTRMLRLRNFEREAGLLATLSHPAIPKVYDYFEENGRIYLIMELVAGRDLESTLDEAGGPIEEARVGRWAMRICDVLEYLHTHQPEPIIFRDLKPSNIMVTPKDQIVLIDFGIARLFESDQRKGTIIGTEGYAPPEQYRGLVDPRGDIYSLGATLHHLLTATDPRGETPFTFHERPIRKLNPAVSPEMEAVVLRALEYDLDARPASIAEMRTLLQTTPALSRLAAAPGTPTVKINPISSPGTELVWTFTCTDEVRSSPTVRDGLLYVGSYDRHLYCLEANNGALRWKRETLGGVSSSPLTWADLVIVGSEDAQVYAMDRHKGNIRWTFRTGGAVRSSPKGVERIIYVGSDDQRMYALDGRNGRQLWQFGTWMPVRSSCALGDDAVFFGSSDGHVYSLDALSGNLRWKQRTQQAIISTPAVGAGMVFAGSMDGHLYALDIEGGSTVWRFKTGHYVNASPALAGTEVFFGGVDGNMYALEAKTGKLVWKFEVGAQITSSPRLHDGSIFFGAVDGTLYKLDAASGSLIWKHTLGGPLVSSPFVAYDKVFIGSLDHHVYALEV